MSSTPVAVNPPEALFYLSKDGQMFGPHNLADVGSFLNDGVLSTDDFLWTEGMEQWAKIGEAVEWPATAPDANPDPVAEEPLSDDLPPIWLRARSDGLSKRLGIGMVAAILLHLCLLVTMTLGAPVMFRLNAVAPTAAPPEPAPLEVAMVEEPPDPPPPDLDSPPPPPDDPPPPPAIPDMPIPTDVPPPAPPPIDIPAPVIAPPTAVLVPLPPPIVSAPKPVRVVHRVQQASVAPTPVDAGPSDYLYAPAPTYPYAARQGREQGTVILLVSIDEAGSPVSVAIDQSSGYPILDAAAQRAVGEFRFRVGDNREFRVPITFQEK